MCYRLYPFRFDYAARYPNVLKLIFYSITILLQSWYISDRQCFCVEKTLSSNPKGQCISFYGCQRFSAPSWSNNFISHLIHQVIGFILKSPNSIRLVRCIYYFDCSVRLIKKRTKMKANRINNSRIFLRPQKTISYANRIDVF